MGGVSKNFQASLICNNEDMRTRCSPSMTLIMNYRKIVCYLKIFPLKLITGQVISQKLQYWHLAQIILCCWRTTLVHYRMLTSILSLYTLDFSSNSTLYPLQLWYPKICQDIAPPQKKTLPNVTRWTKTALSWESMLYKIQEEK